MGYQQFKEKAKYYEMLTRQHEEADEFLQALNTKRNEDFDMFVPNIKNGNASDIVVSTSGIIRKENSTSEFMYKINISKDLGKDLNARLTEFLINEVTEIMTDIENELKQAFGSD